ncbi:MULTISPECIES: histidine kinase [Nostoc]|nr:MULTISPECIES: histidine kinase [Nostoc]
MGQRRTREVAMSLSPLPSITLAPHAQCPMPNAQCPMPNAQCQ